MKVVDELEADLRGAIVTRLIDYAFKFSALLEVDSRISELVELVRAPIPISLSSTKKSTSKIENLLTLLSTNLLILLTPDRISSKLVTLSKSIERHAIDGKAKHSDVLPDLNMSAREFANLIQIAFQADKIEKPIYEDKAWYYRLKQAQPSPAPLAKAYLCSAV